VGWLPPEVRGLLDTALVAELSVVRDDGRVVTYPLIPLFDGERIFMTSSVLFSRKLDHIRSNARVSISLTDPIALGGRPGRATIQGDARVIDDEVHEGWKTVLPMWRKKEPVIDWFLGQRVALPLFFERAVIEIEPRRVLYWPEGRADAAPETHERPVSA
jgi:general stress protein 26